jgi:thymidylate synthase ThyX
LENPDVIDLTYAKIIADSIGVDAPRLVTFELQYPRMIHAEFMTHRVFSRNASSSRAIPVQRMIENILNNCAMPAEWRMNEPGMQGFTVAPPEIAEAAKQVTLMAMQSAINYSKQLDSMGLHKQHVNRLTEPFQYIKVVVTSSQWENFFGLRNHPAADPTIQKLARMMHEAFTASTPELLSDTAWHLPYITMDDLARAEEYQMIEMTPMPVIEILRRMSAARCARVSYNNFKGEVPKVASDLSLYEKLVVSQPVHASPTEHQASPDIFLGVNSGWRFPEKHGNLVGWQQFRKFIPNENLETATA